MKIVGHFLWENYYFMSLCVYLHIIIYIITSFNFKHKKQITSFHPYSEVYLHIKSGIFIFLKKVNNLCCVI